ncbi:hypothetical protein IKF25_01975 [Candidatus Saccharibacteria bacterium]|nr:hypothetical protein [Candidatus Saccharibacteria bacterium]
MFECMKCRRAISAPGLCEQCAYEASGVNIPNVGKNFCVTCSGTGHVPYYISIDGICQDCGGTGTVDIW